MDKYRQLCRYGLFDAKVPRYTSYPPANHFSPVAGQVNQARWLTDVPNGSEISLYLHIPFCKRLCWFCACRTQGTQTMRPVDSYVDTLIAEIDLVRALLPPNISLSRLHLGGGTPTILQPATMSKLLEDIFAAFGGRGNCEFSVEIDPTEAAPELLRTLADHGMNRASIGVQDFDPKVQQAIGRLQSFEQTSEVVKILREARVNSLNMDILYGLPFQTAASLANTLEQIKSLRPDRLALYGYAHVPWISKRQVMIEETALPSPSERFELSQLARSDLLANGYQAIGHDHFALYDDSLAQAARAGTLKRNFQGYTDDPSKILIGLGASAISHFSDGYCQNASATSAYVKRIRQGKLAGLRGYELTSHDQLNARIIEELMCFFALSEAKLCAEFPMKKNQIRNSIHNLQAAFPDLFDTDEGGLSLKPEAHPLVRIIAKKIDAFSTPAQAHSAAI